MAIKPIQILVETDVTGEQDIKKLASTLDDLANTLDGDLKVQAQLAAQAIRELGSKQEAISNFSRLKTEVGGAADRLRDAQTAAQNLGKSLSTGAASTRAQAGQMEKLREAVRVAKTELQAKTRALDQGRDTLRSYGIASTNLATAERSVRQAIAATRSEVASMVPAYSAAATAATASGAKQSQVARAAQGDIKSLGDQLRTVQNIAATAIGGTFITSLARDVAGVADEYSNLAARIKLVTGEGAAFDSAFQGVQRIALATNSELEATGTLFARISEAGKELGLSQEAALGLTQTINQAIQLSGGSAESAKASIIQLVQGLQSGVLRGEEFNSVMEQSPRLAQALAAGLGKTTGELRAMAKEGQLTSEVVLKALQGQADAVASEFSKLPATVGRAIQNLSTNWTIYVGEVDKATGASTAAASAINAVATNLDEIAGFASRAGAVLAAAMAVQAAGAVRTYIVEVVAAQKATSLLALQMSALPKTLQIALAFTGFEVGYQIGDMLLTNSEYAKKFGIAAGDMIEQLYNKFIGLKEIAAAVFTDSTIEEALANYERRMVETSQRTKRMWEEAGNSPKPVEEGALRAALAVQKLGDQAAKTAEVQVASSESTSKALSKEVEAVEALSIARRGDADIAISGLNVQRELARQSLDMAELLGDETAIRKAKIQQIEIEIQITEAKVNVARAEAEGSIAVAQAKLAELQANGELTPVKEAELQLSIRLAQAKLAEAEAVGKSSDLLKKRLDLMKKTGDATEGAAGSANRAADAYKNLDRSIRDASGSIERSGDAFTRLGIKSKTELAQIADQAAKDFERVKASGDYTSEGLMEAWKKMAEASIAANGGVASEALKAEAAMHGLKIEVDDAGNAIIKNMNDGKKAVDGFAKGVADAAAQLQRLKELQGFAAGGGDLSDIPTEDLKKAQADLLKQGGALSSTEYIKLRNELMGRGAPKTDAEGFTLDKSGGRLAMGGELTTLTGIANFLKQAGLGDEQARSVALEFSDGKGGIPYFSNPGQMKYGGATSTISEALLKAAEQTTFGLGSNGATAVGRRYVHDIRLDDAPYPVNTHDEESANNLESIIAQLTRDKRRAM